ncbi:MAG: outer membrane protein assembly factor BamB [Rhodocyclaceae bacterium]|nr:outer membrane protein assembly factor BamB [Rhodocyclaceae bacterium]
MRSISFGGGELVGAIRRRAMLPLLAAMLAGCGTFGSDRELPPLPEFVTGARLELAWKTRLKGSPIYHPAPAVVGRQAAILAGVDGVVERREDGRQVWRVALEQPLSAGVGSDGRLAVVVTQSGEAVALDAADGSEKWRAKVGAEVLAVPAVTGIAVVVRASDSRVFGFSPADGRRMWVYQRPTPALALRSSVGMLTDENVGVTGFPGGKMVAINLANGGALWELTVALPKGTTELERIADVVGTPVLAGRNICAVAFQGRVACFDAVNGDLMWSRDISSAVGLTSDGSHIYLTDEMDAVIALDAATGASVWKQDRMAGRGVGRPLVLGDFVLVSDAEAYVSMLRRDDGALVARAATDGSGVAVPLEPLARDRIAVQTVDGGVFVFTAN